MQLVYMKNVIGMAIDEGGDCCGLWSFEIKIAVQRDMVNKMNIQF